MAQHSTTTDQETRAASCASTPARAGALALVLAPVAFGAAEVFQRTAIGGAGPADPTAYLEGVSTHPGAWNAFGLLLLASALLTAAWVPAVWRLAVDRAPRWAWVAAVLGALYALGQMVHLMSWVVLSEGMAQALDPAATVALVGAIDGSWFFMLIFAPYLLGFLLAAPAAAVALRRARLLPTWGVVLVAAVSVAALVLGTGGVLMIVIYPVALVVAFAPAVVRATQGDAV